MSSACELPDVCELAWELYALAWDLDRDEDLLDAASIARLARAVGERAADSAGALDPLAALELAGVPVVWEQEAADARVHAQYRWEGSRARVTLFRRPIGRIAETAAAAGVDAAAVERAHLAHELFHHLVRTGAVELPPPPAPRGRVRALLLAPRRRRGLEELSAHAFARRACALPVHPAALDWLLAASEDARGARTTLERVARRAQTLERNLHEIA